LVVVVNTPLALVAVISMPAIGIGAPVLARPSPSGSIQTRSPNCAAWYRPKSNCVLKVKPFAPAVSLLPVGAPGVSANGWLTMCRPLGVPWSRRSLASVTS
jgi:hypothetical protein